MRYRDHDESPRFANYRYDFGKILKKIRQVQMCVPAQAHTGCPNGRTNVDKTVTARTAETDAMD